MRVLEYIRLIRVDQWYKNLVIFMAVFFAGKVFDFEILKVILGFFALSFISSANYVINDIIDRHADRKNPEKRTRPIAAKKVSLMEAWLIAGIMLIAGLRIALIEPSFFVIAVLLFILGQIYTFGLKEVLFADIFSIGINFVLRAIAGALIISVFISPWLVLGTFFFAVFLVAGKRKGEIILGKESRKTLKGYSKDNINSILTISAATLVVCYGLFSFSAHNPELIVTIPLFFYLVMRYQALAEINPKIIRHPHLSYKDLPLLIGFIFIIALSYILIYMRDYYYPLIELIL